MRTIENISQDIYIINKSKFISLAYPVSSEEECKDILSTLKKKYSDATHVCFAYILDSPRLEKCSDDGEPSGTAGRPILEVIKKKKISNVLCAVVRYFGGKKLGAGGLIRAYTTSTNMVLEKVNIVDKEETIKFDIEVDIKDGDKLKNMCSRLGANVINCKYSDRVSMTIEAGTEDIKDKILSGLWK